MIAAPELSILGVPKAGTTSIHLWLEKRPNVVAAHPKETFFFMDADNLLANERCNFHKSAIGDYANFFKERSTPDAKTLDSTTHYFFQRTAIEQFAAHNTKVCVVLREPVSRLISYFNYVGYTRSAFKKPLDFSDYVDTLFNKTTQTIEDRFTTKREFVSLATALDQGNYEKYLRQWRDKIKPENIKVMLFEDLVSQRKNFLADLASFFEIAVSDADFEDFEVANEGRGVKFHGINRCLRSISKFATGLPFYEALKKRYLAVQASEKVEFDRDQHQLAIQRLHEYYKPLNAKLSDIVDVDLEKWSSRSMAS